MVANMKKSEKILLSINIVIISAILVLNYFYQLNGFDFTLKCICSGGFTLTGLINLVYALVKKASSRKFYISMSLGLILAFLGDYFINGNFILGAAAFALGHVFFVVAYCFINKPGIADFIISGAIFLGSAAYLMFYPELDFGSPLFKAVCIVYSLIISAMLGKAVGNFIKNKTKTNALMALSGFLFFFSDLMLVLDWFIGKWTWTDHACMGTYYPALCFLALSMLLKTFSKKQ